MQLGLCISRPPVLCLAPDPGSGSQFVFTGPGPQFAFTSPGPQFVFNGPAPNLYLPALAPNFYLPVLVSLEPGLGYTNLVPPICVYWAWPTICITVLWICVYFLICGSSSCSSNSSNFFGLQSSPRYVRQTVVFLWNSTLRERFNFYFSIIFC